MRKRSTRVTRAAAAIGALTLLALSPVDPIDALENEVVHYDPTSGESYTYHADVVMAPTDGGTLIEPEDCATVTWCTMVPIVITPLERDELSDWLVQIDIDWDDTGVTTPDVGGTQTNAQGNDLDTYLYTFGPILDDEGNPTTNEDGTPAEGYTLLSQSAGSTAPEIMKLYRPTAKEYFLVVTNFVGVNRGFDLVFSTSDVAASDLTPFYDTPKPAAPASGSGGRLALGSQPAPRFTPPPPPAPASAPAVAFEDDDFGFSSAVPDDLLEGDEGPTRGSLFAEEVVAPPTPVGGGTVLVWLGIVPLALVAGLAVWVVRRRPSALSIRFPVVAGAAEPVAE